MRKALLVFALLSLVVAVAAPTTVAAAPDDTGLAPDGTTIYLGIQGDGDARWTISTSYVLNESSERAAFEEVAARFRRGDGSFGFSLEPFERVVPQVADRTGRDMTIRDAEWTTAIQNESGVQHGVLRLSFTWTNFANVTNETVTLGGAFGGGWFGDLGPSQTLVIRPPPGFDVSGAQPPHETVNGTLRWTGPVDFQFGEPNATFQREPPAPPMPWATVAGAVVAALVVGGIIAYVWLRRSGRHGPAPGAEKPPAGAERAPETSGAPVGGEAEREAPIEGEPTGTGASETATGTPTAGEAGTTAPSTGPVEESEPEPELLSDEERVERLLREHGGRMKQTNIVDETRWSNAKVSQLLSQMADADRVEKLRIGRENLISLPEENATGDEA